MPEADFTEEKNFYEGIPQKNSAFFLKGAGAYDWGMQNRLARVFNPDSGKTVMLAIDHGYFQGPTTGLERVDVNILPLVPYTDALFCTRGILRSVVPAATSRRRSWPCNDGSPSPACSPSVNRGEERSAGSRYRPARPCPAERLTAAQNHVGIDRIELDRHTPPARPLGGDQRGP
jgi:hypothetical protein